MCVYIIDHSCAYLNSLSLSLALSQLVHTSYSIYGKSFLLGSSHSGSKLLVITRHTCRTQHPLKLSQKWLQGGMKEHEGSVRTNL